MSGVWAARVEAGAVDFGSTLATGPTEPAGARGAGRLVDAAAVAALHALSDAGYRLVLSSNVRKGRSRRPALARARVLGLFDAAIESDAVGAAKPQRAFYAALPAAVGCPPGRIVHVGDRLDNDVKVPCVIGMRAAHIRPYTTPGACLPPKAVHLTRFADLPGCLEAAGEGCPA